MEKIESTIRHYQVSRRYWRRGRARSLGRCLWFLARALKDSLRPRISAYRPTLGLRLNDHRRWQWYM